MPAISGFAGRVQLGGTSGTKMTANRWQVMWKTDALDVTCFESQGGPSTANASLSAFPGPPAGAGQFSQQGTAGATAKGVATPVSNWTPGITDLEVSVDCYWDTGIAPFASTPVLCPGLIVNTILFYNRSSLSASFTAFVLIESVNMDVEVRGVVKYSFTGKVAGTDSAAANAIPPTV